ncbi:MAG: penicillin-binding protein 2, partial [Candidatus Cloacimonetes bacterium]|nr:penicillin-binding protein 2 [Candidatus Cloacimonadota bacterium]
RGEIYDQRYRPIAINVPSQNLHLVASRIKDLPALKIFLDTYSGIKAIELDKLLEKHKFRNYEEILLTDNIPFEQALSISEQLNYFPELVIRTVTTRNYLYPNHFTGYIGRIDEKEYSRYRFEDYSLSSYIGKSGLERYYEVLLRGKDGREIIQVDAQGRSLNLFKTEGTITPQNGLSLLLTIDNDLQDYVNAQYPDQFKGAIVVIDVKTGGILSYVSRPNYDPNLFMQKITPEIWDSLNDASKPMMDRIIHAAYPPGSVFKPITGSLGLEKGVVDRNTLLAPCVGGMQVGNRFFRCWLHGGHGRSNIIDALKVSCDVYFYDLSLKLDLDEYNAFTNRNMLGVATGVDLPNERSGLFPNRNWYRTRFGKNVGIIGHKVNLSIGQGEVLTTPLQICAYYAAIANNGLWIQPHLLKQTIGRGRFTREQVSPLKKVKLPVSPENLKIIQEGLFAVCNLPGGTASNVRVPGATVYGKTGSAENFMGPLTHAWFTGYVVTDKPEIAVNVFFENAGGGGALAGPIAARIFNYYIGNYDIFTQPVPVPAQFRTEEDSPQPEAETDPPPGSVSQPESVERSIETSGTND